MSACTALLASLATGWPPGAHAGVVGTVHDMTQLTGEVFRGPCEYCHVAHKAQGERLWAVAAYGPTEEWGSRPIAQLCYTCHNNSGGGFNASDVTATAYSPLAHGYRTARVPASPDGGPQALAPLPYVESGLMDCTTCHDPHGATPPFLRGGSIDALCKECHARENPGLTGRRNRYGTPESPYSLHPTDIEYTDIPDNGVTNLHPLPEVFAVPTASGAWKLGGHRVGWQAETGAISCQSCHPVHGGWNYNQGVLPGPPASNLTPIENRAGTAASLCQACHQGGDAGETVGTGGDHPMNRKDGTPPVVYPAGWPSGTQGEVTCSSCHDAHGGTAETSLLRTGGNIADGWCFSCHSVESLLPPYHHSSRENDEPQLFTSMLTCGDCHGRGPGWAAHNGFDDFKVAPDPGRSALCEACHVPENPLQLDEARYTAATGLPISFAAAVQPALHGPVRGSASHLIDEADDDSIANCQIKKTPWQQTGGLSRYGTGGEVICESCHSMLTNAGLLLGSASDARRMGGWRTNLLLEPYEDNSPGVGIESPDFVVGPTLSALCRGCHYAVREDIPPSFVHNPSAHTVEGYEYPPEQTPYGREHRGVLTEPIDSRGEGCPEVSSADQMVSPSGSGPAPGANSYPAQSVLDCDSCHRPHGAHDASKDDGKRRILEYTAPGGHGTAPCAECHDTESQCGF